MIRDNNLSKNIHTLISFVEYCQENPEQRFWQALRNWNQIRNPEVGFILTATKLDINHNSASFIGIKNTFNRE